MTTPRKNVDRRIQRTRQLLQQALKEIVYERGRLETGVWGIERCFQSISIQDITERANVNRGTFYLHFADKYMLMETITREQFQQIITSKLPSVPRWSRETLQLLIHALLENFEQKYCHQRYSSLVLIPLLEQAMHEELTTLLLSLLQQEKSLDLCKTATPETIANIVSWTIFGTAIQWSQQETSASKEQITEAILQIISKGTHPPLR